MGRLQQVDNNVYSKKRAAHAKIRGQPSFETWSPASEELLKTLNDQGGDAVAALRVKLSRNISTAKQQMNVLGDALDSISAGSGRGDPWLCLPPAVADGCVRNCVGRRGRNGVRGRWLPDAAENQNRSGRRPPAGRHSSHSTLAVAVDFLGVWPGRTPFRCLLADSPPRNRIAFAPSILIRDGRYACSAAGPPQSVT